MSRKRDLMRLGASRARAGVIALAAAAAAATAAAGVASAQTGAVPEMTTGTTTTTGSASTQGATSETSESGGTGTTDSSTTTASGSTKSGGGRNSMELMAEAAAPARAFAYGDHRIVYQFAVDGDHAKDLKIQAVRRRNWRTVRVWRRASVEPGTHKVRWNGTKRNGKVARKGTYLFRVRTMHGANLDRTRAKGDNRSVKLFPYKFPVRAHHTYGDGYGAPRSGHVHQGQDILAKCAKRVVAVRGGRVQYRGYQAGGAGYYVVIDGRADSHDYVYMHLRKRGPKKGTRVRTGETIGRVGRTGDASACHLHFEMWSRPGWYEGGRALRSVTKHLKKWDHWS